MGKKVWTFTVKDGNHTVALEHDYFSGRRKITVDDRIILETGKHLMDAGSMYRFQVSGVPCQVLIERRFVTLGFKYSVYVHEKSVNGERVRQVKGIRQRDDALSYYYSFGYAGWCWAYAYWG